MEKTLIITVKENHEYGSITEYCYTNFRSLNIDIMEGSQFLTVVLDDSHKSFPMSTILSMSFDS